ncbi:hypothetical protein JFT85_14415 [Pseudomonas sp. TH04]|uniref:hypothetical protein n=1 Tax=Pseudomonas sp. TH04 TaxID=2796370 RepID=UPI0019146096|nr:hypothetical protein [Pseudomonas sp. TH04]MBK5545962.1 hypothetical protein [Pseudomonas sp. TH04]
MGDDNVANPFPRDFIKKHGDLFDRHFPPGVDDESLILKTHLLLEAVLRDFCASCVPHPEHLLGARFQFNQVVRLARAMCPTVLNEYSETLWTLAKHLNLLRNAMAHELEPDHKKVEKEKKVMMDLVGHLNKGQNSDLRATLEYLLGSMNAFLQFALYVGQHQREDHIE